VSFSTAQGFFGLQAHPNGAITPVDEPAVAAARADHLATKFGAGGYAAGYGAGVDYFGYGAGLGYSGYGASVGYTGYGNGLGYASYGAYAPGYAAGYGYSAAPLVGSGFGYSGYAPAYAAGYGYAGPLNLNTQLIAHPNGAVVPLDEPAVAAARAAHLDIQSAEYAASAPILAAAPLVAAAPAIAAAPLVASAPYAAVGYGYGGPLNLNTQLVAHPNGAIVPVDEPAVAAARADHIATKGVYGGVYAAAAPAAYFAGYGAGYAPYAGLVAHPNGAVVPVDEPAVAAARADHLAAHGY